MASKLSHHASRDSSRDASKEATVEQWTYSDVVKWLTDHRLAQVTNRSVIAYSGARDLQRRGQVAD